MIPKGDFTKQKYIVGRITESKDDDNETKTFNFKLPFDNFIGLEDLTHNNSMQNHGYLANKPTDGAKIDLDAEEIISNVTSEHQNEIASATELLKRIKTWQENCDYNLKIMQEILNDLAVNQAGSRLNAYSSNERDDEGHSLTLYEAIRNAVINGCETYADKITLNYLSPQIAPFFNQFGTRLELYQDDYNRLWTVARGAHDRTQAVLTLLAQNTDKSLRQGIDNAYESIFYNSDLNYNYLWSWSRVTDRPVLETKLGIGVDFKTLLGNQRPISGDYGLRILITGRTKPTEEAASQQVTEEVYLRMSDMYGNAYAFYEPQAQQKIFDISGFLTLDRIDIFFWQDHNFVAYNNTYIAYQNAAGADLPANIFVSDLVVKLGLTVDECQTDRVFLYTYDDVYYGYDPLDDTATEDQLKETRELQFAWVHLSPTGPILVNHMDYYPAGNEEDQSSLAYWKKHNHAQIQWYHFEYGCAQDTTKLEERQGGLNWAYLGSGNANNFTYTVVPDISKAKEKWKAIVSFDSVPFETEPLIFSNRDINVETEAFDSLNEVVFKILHESFSEQTPDGVIVEDNTLRNFYVYDINDRALKDELNRSYSAIDYYIQVWIRNNDTGEYLPMTYDPDEGLVDIEFHWPTNNSMIADWSEVYDDDLSRAELAPLLAGASSQYNERIKAITRKFHIRDTWQAYRNNNTITATVKRRGKTYYPSLELNFGQSSSMGTDSVLTMSVIQPANGVMVKDQPFSVEAIIRDKAGNIDSNSRYIFAWDLLSPTLVTNGVNDPLPTNPLLSVWSVDNSHGFLGNIITGVVRNDEPPIFKVTVTNATDYPISQTNGFKMGSDTNTVSLYIINACAERVEFKADGTVPLSYYGDFTTQHYVNDEFVDYYPEWYMDQWYKRSDGWAKLDEPLYFGLITKPHFSSNAILTTQANPRVWVQIENGAVNYDTIESTQVNSSYQSSSFEEIKTFLNRDYTQQIQNTQSSDDLVTLEGLYNQRLQKLTQAAGLQQETKNVYALDPYYKSNSSASWQWEDLLANYYTKIYFYLPTSSSWLAQSIPFTRNLYSSTLLNSWNGKLTIDETNNAILSQMISAGTRNDHDGKFTGVVMGNWAGVSDSSLDIPGIYGLSNGEQVFGFKTDSTGFIGRSGRGRIMFDGNQSLISNADKTSYINLDPIRYHFENNQIILDDYKGYSEYFLYSKVKKTSTASLAGEDKLEDSTRWAKSFLEDTSNDYFVVDPNNGVLTSGGIIARYGKLGNWMISSSGIYQRSTNATGTSSTENRYMYLGYPGITDAQLQAATKSYNDVLNKIEQERNIALNNIRAEELINNIDELSKYYKQIFALDPMHYFNYFWPLIPYYTAIKAALDAKVETDAERRDLFETKFLEELKKENRSMAHWHYQFTSTGDIKSKTLQHVGVYPIMDNYGEGIDVYLQYLPTHAIKTGGSWGEAYYHRNTADARQAADNWTRHPDYAYTVFFQNDIVGNDMPQLAVASYAYQHGYGTKDPRSEMIARGLPVSIESLHLGVLSTFSVAHLTELYNWCINYYSIGLYNFMQQLNAMLAAGIAELDPTERAQYESYVKQHSNDHTAEIARINDLYDKLRAPVEDSKNKAIADLYAADKNRYAIYCGYDDPTIASAKPPLFTVNWRGYMTARAGKIGYESPWYISDYGLTQTNNFGTIFLGNPEAPAEKTEWFDIGDDAKDLTLLPNHDEENSPLVLGASENLASRGKFAIYAGNKGYYWEYDTVTEKYQRKAETSATIKFGVRMDGTLYAINGTVGGWNLTQNMLYSGNTNDPSDLLVLDANRGVISLGGAIVLQKDGTVTLGKMGQDGTSAGIINIAGVIFKGRSSDEVNWSIPTYSLNADTGDVLFEAGTYKFWGSTKDLTTATITARSASAGTVAHKLRFTSLLDIVNSAARPIGVTIAIGEQTNDNTKKAVAIYPTTLSTENSVLGTKDHPWDIVADYISASNLDVNQGNISAKNFFMSEEDAWHLVATQFWVRQQLQDVYSKIKDAASGGASAGQRALSAGKSLAGSIAALESLLAQLINGTDFLQAPEGEKTIDFKDSQIVINTAQYEITSWTDPVISDGESGDTLAAGTGNIKNNGTYTIRLNAYNLRWGVGGSNSDSLRDVINGLITVSEDANGMVLFDTSTKILSGGLTANGGTSYAGLEGTVGKNTHFSFSLNHTHEPTFTAPSGTAGTVELTIGEADFSKATSEKATFDVAKTNWYINQVVGPGADNDSTSKQTTFALWLDSSQTVAMSKSYSTSLSEDVAGKKVDLKHSGATIGTISTADTYAAGWDAACDKIGSISASNGNISITVPKKGAVGQTTSKTGTYSQGHTTSHDVHATINSNGLQLIEDGQRVYINTGITSATTYKTSDKTYYT